MRSNCSSGPRRCSRPCRRSIRANSMRWARRSVPATASRWQHLSTALIAGLVKSFAPAMPTPICRALPGWRRYGKRSSAPRATLNRTIWNENHWFFRFSGCSRKRRGSTPPDLIQTNSLDRHLKEFAVATSKKKALKKRKAKKVRKAAPARASKAAAAKKRAAKSRRGVTKTGKPAKRVAKKAAKTVTKKSTKKTAKKSAKKAAKNTAKKAAKKAVAKKAVAKQAIAVPKKAGTVDRTSSAENAPKVAALRAVAPKPLKSAPAPKPAPASAAERNTYFITTAIAYPNGQPHIGHAYEAIATDALARFQRLDGKDVFFLTGTDEHGQKM